MSTRLHRQSQKNSIRSLVSNPQSQGQMMIYVFQILKVSNYQPRSLDPAKLPFKIDGDIRTCKSNTGQGSSWLPSHHCRRKECFTQRWKTVLITRAQGRMHFKRGMDGQRRPRKKSIMINALNQQSSNTLRKRKRILPTTNKITGTVKHPSIVTINVHGLNSSIKRHRLSDWNKSWVQPLLSPKSIPY